jgi:hypothetical protein
MGPFQRDDEGSSSGFLKVDEKVVRRNSPHTQQHAWWQVKAHQRRLLLISDITQALPFAAGMLSPRNKQSWFY